MEQNINQNIGEASFNQAGYSQLRLHNLFMRIDELNSNLSAWNCKYGSYNYNIVFNNLVSAYSTISSKLNETEKKDMIQKREAISNLLITNPPYKQMPNAYGRMKGHFSLVALEDLSKLFIEFRDLIENLMEKYHIGNPNKESEGGYD